VALELLDFIHEFIEDASPVAEDGLADGSLLDYMQAGLWIRIGSGFRDFVDPDPYWESGSGSRGKKTKKFQ
jgi:hypothetical protein